jgi:uncharacterized protein (DUF302 family)
MIEHGLNTLLSRRSVGDTVEALVGIAEASGFKIFARIDHAAGAEAAGCSLRPNQLVIFGHPDVGSRLMAENPVTGIDLPMRALVWEDRDGEVWITYPDAGWIAARHGLGTDSVDAVASIRATTSRIVVQAAGI